ncbi:lytic transglycosylase [Frigidibacter sp. SD6-1]|uniref:transglycosylase SLT domain-containing protein n=1 Tax=Frigidibacter sp. SD6-1 TaxID=3032581 RepID=UPI0024DF85AC|nr:lytic transglycosylase [Frigidibacter sp. SD6-1]
MKKFLRLAVLMALVSCGGGERTAPRNLDNACAILDERPHYLRALEATERRWGIPRNVLMATIHQESKFIGNAKTPHKFALGIIPMGRQSSAYGYSQAIDGTWDDYRKATGRFGAKRTRFDDAADFMGWYMNEAVSRHGVSPYDATSLYLAYHEGLAGYGRGTHLQKAWLMRVAANVGERSQTYQNQLIYCGKL